MKITEFQNFIREFPYKNQSFDIKRRNWGIENQNPYIDKIFNGKEMITINRSDLMNSDLCIKDFIFMTLMWGYPTKGRGRNIEILLKEDNLEKLIEILERYKAKEISIEQLRKDTKSIHGLGFSTITKFAYFLNTTVNGYKTVILDNRIEEAINSKRFEEFNGFENLTILSVARNYCKYLDTIAELSSQMNVEPDQIEMFLFSFGRGLSE